MTAHEMSALADPLHMRAPRTWRPSWSRDLDVPALRSDPEWSVTEAGVWISYVPTAATVADQGWKIHVSATEADAPDTVAVTARICAERGVAFKHLASTAMVVATNLRRSPRSAAGKTLAAYPADEARAVELADALADALTGRDAPYVLSDARWRDDAPVYLRYGAYLPFQTYTDDGRRLPARRLPDGTWTHDDRRVPFRLPADVTPGDRIARTLTHPPLSAEFPVAVTEVVQHTTCGGVYRGTHRASGRPVVLKEARPLTGGSPVMTDAVTRLRRESETLQLLGGSVTPEHVETFTWDGHLFVAAEEVPGQSLRHWAAQHHPALDPAAGPADFAAHARTAALVTERLHAAVRTLHAAGVAHNDIHPANVLITDDLTVRLVDLELADDADGTDRPPLRCGGFSADTGTGRERDLLGVAMIGAWLLHPAIGASAEIAPDLLTVIADEAERWYGELAAPVRDAAGRYARHGARLTPREPRERLGAAPCVTPDRLVTYLHQEARPDETVLLPGDAATYSSALSCAALEHGASGAVAALLAAGSAVPAAWLEHLERATEHARFALPAPGLWDGWSGLALVHHLLGDEDRARDVADRALAAADGCTDPRLATGRAGIALTLLQLDPAGRHGLADRATDLLAPLAADPDTWLPRAGVGLCDGPSGVAAVLATAGQRLGEPGWVGAAERWLDADLGACTEHPSGALALVSDRRQLPYLGDGSLGLALARGHVRRLLGHDAADTTQRRLALAADVRTCVEGGLRYGRAGLAWGMRALAALEPDPALRARWTAVADGHETGLTIYALDVDAGTTVVGRGSFRATADLATGAAGVLAATVPAAHPFLSLLFGLAVPERHELVPGTVPARALHPTAHLVRR